MTRHIRRKSGRVNREVVLTRILVSVNINVDNYCIFYAMCILQRGEMLGKHIWR